MWRCTRYSVFSAGAESVTTKRLAFWNGNGSKTKILYHAPWSLRPRTGTSGVTPLPVLKNIFKHCEQCSRCSTNDNYYNQNILIIIGSSCSCSSGSSSQVNTVRLRLMNAGPSPVSTMEHVLTYWGTTRAGVLQVCGNMTWNTRFLYSL